MVSPGSIQGAAHKNWSWCLPAVLQMTQREGWLCWGRKGWNGRDDGRTEELWGVHMCPSLLQLRGAVTKVNSHRHTQRKTDIQDNDAWNTRAYMRSHQEASLTELPEFYWGVTKRAVGCKGNDADGVFHCVKHFSICVLCIILASRTKCKNTACDSLCAFYLRRTEYLCGLRWERWLWCRASY